MFSLDLFQKRQYKAILLYIRENEAPRAKARSFLERNTEAAQLFIPARPAGGRTLKGCGFLAANV